MPGGKNEARTEKIRVRNSLHKWKKQVQKYKYEIAEYKKTSDRRTDGDLGTESRQAKKQPAMKLEKQRSLKEGNTVGAGCVEG